MAVCTAQAEDSPKAIPERVFIQAGTGEDADTLVAGAIWPLGFERDFAAGRLTTYWEASLGRWRGEGTTGIRSSAWVTQLGITPVLRWYPTAWGERWFVEGGIGVNWLLPIYRSRDKQFSTSFNFGDHIGIGRSFGVGRNHELSLRLQHFSNGGIKKPNPGEEFIQLRWVWRF